MTLGLRIASRLRRGIISGPQQNKTTMPTTAKQTVRAFIERINAHDVEGLRALMSDDHTFIDAHGNQVCGKKKMIAGWRAYFEWFPDYSIEITDVFEESEMLALFGFAGGSFQGKPTESWRLPAAWKGIVRDGSVTLWQVFADTKIPFEIIERNAKELTPR